MKFPLLGKAGALGAVVLALLAGLHSIDGIVNDRQMRQREAAQSVVDSLAGAQTVLGPLLQRRCQEQWDHLVDDKWTKTEKRDFVLHAWPARADIQTNAAIEPRYRGLFKVNSYLARSTLKASWPSLAGLQPKPEAPGGRVQCEAPTIAVALEDARGIRSATIKVDGTVLAVAPSSLFGTAKRGFHAVLTGDRPGPLEAEITLDLAGTDALSWSPIADQTTASLESNWPHPSFAGRFLPAERRVGDKGFSARWQVSALATSAQQTALADASGCAVLATCADSFGVSFIDPVNAYVLSDRALRYGLLFIALTFVGVGLVELMRQVRVHPVQYLLVGCALTLFFLLLVSLGEHLAFGWAYACAASACTGLLTFYGRHILQGWRAGAGFGGAIATLYAALYALLQLEQTALVLGALLLFVALTAVMAATRRMDWYALSGRLQAQA